MSAFDYFDTSAILNNPSLLESNLPMIVSRTVIAELEEIKNSSTRDNDIKAAARRAARALFAHQNIIQTPFYSQKEVEKVWRKFQWLPHNNDGIILAEAAIWNRKNPQFTLVFWTADYNQYLAAKQLGFTVKWCGKDKDEAKEPWKGWSDFYLTDEKMAALYSNPSFNVLDAKANEYCKIYETGSNELKDVLRWDGEKFCKLKYSNFRNSFLGKNIQPLNLEQKMAFDLLQNQNLSVKVLTGVPGGGKDYLGILHALDMVQKGIFDKIIYVRNLIPFKDAPEIGFLAGDLEQKIEWGLGPIKSLLGEEGLYALQEQGIIQNTNLAFCRGMSWDRSLIYVSEGQNISGGGYKLLVSRCGQGSQIWINGDFSQTDTDHFKRDNGIVRITNSLAGNPLFGTVKLTQTERSKTAELAAII